MPDQETHDPMTWVLRIVTAGLVVLGAWGFVGSTTHVLHLAREHGQEGWLAWNVAGPIELLAVLCGVEIQIRARRGQPAWFPKFGLALTVAFVVLANLAQAESSPWGYAVAVAAPACFFIAAGLIETRYGRIRKGKGKTGKAPAQPASPARNAQQPPARPSEPPTAEKPAQRRTAPRPDDAVSSARGAKAQILARLLEEGRAAAAAGEPWTPDAGALSREIGKSLRSAQVYIQTVKDQLAEEAAA